MTYLPDNRVTYLAIHYSATPIERDYTAADIDEMHRRRGFKEIGYHYFIRKDGTVEAGRDLTEPGRFEMGAHSKGENDQSIGICYEGGVRASAPNLGFDSRTPQQIAAMKTLIEELLKRFPNAVVRGHRDMPGAATQCPGFDASAWWDGVARKRDNIFADDAFIIEPTPVAAPVEPVAAPAPAVAAETPAPPAKTPFQSTTIRAAVLAAMANGGGLFTAWSALTDTDKMIAGGLAAITLAALLWIFSERIKKMLQHGI